MDKIFSNKNSLSIYGDCFRVMNKLAYSGIKIDAFIIDPPYGTTKCSWDSILPFNKIWEYIKILRKPESPILIFGNEPFSSYLRISNITEYRYDIYWKKERPTNIFQINKRPGKIVENISVFYKKQPIYNPQKTNYNGPKRSNKIKNGRIGTLLDSSNKIPKEYVDNGTRFPNQIVQINRDILKNRFHPTQKPVELLEYLIRTYTDENHIVMDFCMGSGTCGVACKKLKRKFIGIEKEYEFFKTAKNRINSFDANPSLLVP